MANIIPFDPDFKKKRLLNYRSVLAKKHVPLLPDEIPDGVWVRISPGVFYWTERGVYPEKYVLERTSGLAMAAVKVGVSIENYKGLSALNMRFDPWGPPLISLPKRFVYPSFLPKGVPHDLYWDFATHLTAGILPWLGRDKKKILQCLYSIKKVRAISLVAKPGTWDVKTMVRVTRKVLANCPNVEDLGISKFTKWRWKHGL